MESFLNFIWYICLSYYFVFEDKHAKREMFSKPGTEKPPSTENIISLRKRKKSEPEGNLDAYDLDSVILSEPRKKIQKITLSNTIDGESVAKLKYEAKLNQSFVQTNISCARGSNHTITLSDDGILHSFGYNTYGQLGLGHNNDISLPTPIPNLPQINQISCGGYFTVCVDCDGFMWSFGKNNSGQLGTGNTTNFNVPQKLINIPPVLSVACGFEHTLMITNDSDLWSWGSNDKGQLCLGYEKGSTRHVPQKTLFSNISKLSAGFWHSLFENNKGEIFACGYNQSGQCGLGHFNELQITPSLILNVPPNIVHFVCGHYHNLFLDSEGNAFSVGSNAHGQLGLGHKTDQNELNKIPNIPPIKIISCGNLSCYLIDFEGNLWTFGYNRFGQLGHGDNNKKKAPKMVNTIKNIQQISYGSCGQHFFAKNSQNQIFVTGNNAFGQLGTGDSESVSIPKEINSQYSTIWRDEFYTRAKSARK